LRSASISGMCTLVSAAWSQFIRRKSANCRFFSSRSRATVEFVVGRRKACMGRKDFENLQNRPKLLRVKLGRKNPETISAAPFNFNSSAFDRSNEFRKNPITRQIHHGFRFVFCFSPVIGRSWNSRVF
jgi:hypothetical protein